MIGSMFAYGVFFPALESELGWSRTLLSGCISLSFLVMGIGAIGAGQLNDSFGARGVMMAAGLIYGTGYVLMYYLAAPWQLFVLYGFFIGLGLATHDVVTLSIIARNFSRRRGTMTGVVKVGTACGQIVIPLVASVLLAAYGWRIAFVALGVGAGLLLMFAGYWLGLNVEQPGQDATPQARTGMPFKQALRSRALWILCVVQFSFFPTLATIPVHLPVFAQDMGMQAAAAAALLAVIGGVSIVGRLLIGNAADRIGGRLSMFICLVILTSSLAFLTTAETHLELYVFASIYGVGHGGLFTVVSPTIAEYFGMRAHGALFGVVLFCGTLGAAGGPLLAGWIFDQTGSYGIAFWGLAGMAATAALLVLTLPRPIKLA